jgi:dynamin 1-like protein
MPDIDAGGGIGGGGEAAALIGAINDVHAALAEMSSSSPVDGGFEQANNSADNDDGLLVLDLPRIVVIGSQSSGKSSLLESLIGKGDLLPRGRDIVTRRPLIIQLRRQSTSDGGERATDYAAFAHRPGKHYLQWEEVRREIEAETERTVGTKKAVGLEPIHVAIHSRDVLDLTLVDLPGLTKIPVGEQPPDIEHQVRQLALSYVQGENALILAVTPANIDLVNSDALKLARQADPAGSRTVGVLTKLDLMDAGTNCADILGDRGPVILRPHGFHGVVLRGQQDIQARRPLPASLAQERDFFRYPSSSPI